MKIEHIGIWVDDLELMREFYMDYFNLTSNKKYYNPKKKFSSYFLSFYSGPRIELMHMPSMTGGSGMNHIAIKLDTKDRVDILTDILRVDGYEVVGEPRTTGDGYYESVVKDPEGNLIELTE